ncbi:hypothetical protein F384_17165 [Citrobacter amalonaticus Y19]|uniref:Uncharacterized protein n=1 Tax=Citrobacter amalonaticus Y19 TaxID=1261127 RepID=A0A0F6TWN0_CITAM|nr:hypothetical protein F384_17165 [Citrobacter amalonaticus Y19]
MTVHDRTRLIGQLHLFMYKPAPAGFLLLQVAATLLPDGALLIRPTNIDPAAVGRIRCDSIAIRHGVELLAK